MREGRIKFRRGFLKAQSFAAWLAVLSLVFGQPFLPCPRLAALAVDPPAGHADHPHADPALESVPHDHSGGDKPEHKPQNCFLCRLADGAGPPPQIIAIERLNVSARPAPYYPPILAQAASRIGHPIRAPPAAA